MNFVEFYNTVHCNDCLVKPCCKVICDKNISYFKKYINHFIVYNETKIIDYGTTFKSNEYKVLEDNEQHGYMKLQSKDSKCLIVSKRGLIMPFDFKVFNKLGWQDELQEEHYDLNFRIWSWKRAELLTI